MKTKKLNLERRHVSPWPRCPPGGLRPWGCSPDPSLAPHWTPSSGHQSRHPSEKETKQGLGCEGYTWQETDPWRQDSGLGLQAWACSALAPAPPPDVSLGQGPEATVPPTERGTHVQARRLQGGRRGLVLMDQTPGREQLDRRAGKLQPCLWPGRPDGALPPNASVSCARALLSPG